MDFKNKPVRSTIMNNNVLEVKVWQCAWCYCLMVNGEKIKNLHKAINTSHGICHSCEQKVLKKTAKTH